MRFIYANIRQPNESEALHPCMVMPSAHLFYSFEEFHKATFSPLTEYEAIVFEVRGKTYAERKANAQAIAVEFSNIAYCGGLSWSDICTLSDWFYTIGKRYGLLTEFRENGLC